jgi:F-type H+-transporting ATPase subunit epsilon
MFTLTLVSPEKKILTDVPIEEVFVPGYRGELNILPGHAPLMTTLNTGVLRFRRQGSSTIETAAISWGYCEVHPNGVNVLAETIELPEEIDLVRAENARHSSWLAIKEKKLSPEETIKFQRKVARADVRIKLVKSDDSKTTH